MSDITFRRGFPSTPNPPVGTILTSPPVGPTPEMAGDADMVERNLQFLRKPEVQAALIAFGASAMQGVPAGQTDYGALGTSISRGVNAAGQVQAGQGAAEQQEFENRIQSRRLGADEAQAAATLDTAAAQREGLAERARQFDATHGLARDKFSSDAAFRNAQLELDGLSASANQLRAQAAVEGNAVAREQLQAQADRFEQELDQRKAEFTETNLNERVRAGAEARRAEAAVVQAGTGVTRAQTERDQLELQRDELAQRAEQFAATVAADKSNAERRAATQIFQTLLEQEFLADRTDKGIEEAGRRMLDAMFNRSPAGPKGNDVDVAPREELMKQSRIRKLQDPVTRALLVEQLGAAQVVKMEQELGLR